MAARLAGRAQLEERRAVLSLAALVNVGARGLAAQLSEGQMPRHRVALLGLHERRREPARSVLDVHVWLGRLEACGELGRDVDGAPLTARLSSADEGQTREHRRPEERRDRL